MRPLIALFLILAIISNIKGSYSIDDFIVYLQNTGLYDILVNIKHSYGSDICITFCKFIVIQTKDCEEVVKVYFPSKPAGTRGERSKEEETKNILQFIDDNIKALQYAGVKPFQIEKLKEEMKKYN